MQASILPLGQQETISDCAFDFYGLRLASCGLDAKIRLFRLDESTGEWTSETEWRAHDAPISRVAWAHPEQGNVIASSSFDRTVKIWQEAERTAASPAPRWIERAVLTEARGSVRDLAFADSRNGFKLATISADSMLRVYECVEIYNVSAWTMTEELDVSTFGGTTPSLTPAVIPTPGLENGSPSSSDGILGRPATPSLTHASRLAASAGSREAESGWCLSWCKERSYDILAVSSGTTPTVKIISLQSPPARPVLLASLDHRPPERMPPQAITSISWAPMSGRSYHLIATGSRDAQVRVWKLKVNAPTTSIVDDEREREKEKWTAALVGEFGDHKSAVGRVEWNVTGTVLSSAGDDGQIRFWKALSNVWRKIGSFNTHHLVDNDATGDEDTMMG
ncbi:WD40 repeat-like protein [Clavulina sp. PMI_390]|nr:WD40 repeat-like protein [Clavulina sp. PMI_390]